METRLEIEGVAIGWGHPQWVCRNLGNCRGLAQAWPEELVWPGEGTRHLKDAWHGIELVQGSLHVFRSDPV